MIIKWNFKGDLRTIVKIERREDPYVYNYTMANGGTIKMKLQCWQVWTLKIK